MDARSIVAFAQANLLALGQNPYPGRGIVAGLDETGQYLVQVYWIMGRSENSRNRVFKADNETGRLFTEAADPSKVKDPSLIIYNAMRERGDWYNTLHYVVSNGDQTDTVVESMGPLSLYEVLAGRRYEPDAPNFTQRITAVHSLWKERPFLQMSILRRSMLGEACDGVLFVYDQLHPGYGYCITTYSGDGDPLPPFYGDPIVMPLVGGMQDIAWTYWDSLNEANRVSLAVKWIEVGNGRSDIRIINKNTQS
jgi:IMP cyclohydrolase